MRLLSNPFQCTLTFAPLVPPLALMWLLAVPHVLTPLSYALFAGLLMTLAGVALNAFKNAQATVNVVHLLHDANRVGPSAARGVRRAAAQHAPQV